MKNSLNKAKVIIITIIGIIAVVLISSLAGVNLDLIDFSTKSSALGNSGQCGENVFYTFDENTGTLVISGEGDMYNSYYREPSVTSVVEIGEAVTAIITPLLRNNLEKCTQNVLTRHRKSPKAQC